MPKTAVKNTVKVKIDVRPGSVSPAQKTAYRKFWEKLMAEVKREATK